MCAAPQPASEHRALLYDSLDHFVDASAAFVRDGLERDEPVWLISGSPSTDALIESLGDAAAALELTAAEEWFRSPSRTLTTLRHRLDEHSGPGVIRALGEIPWTSMRAGTRTDWMGVEAALNHVLADRPAHMLCAYDAQRLPDRVIDHARRTHAAVQTRDGLAPSAAYAAPDVVLAELRAAPMARPPRHAASLQFDDRPGPARDFVAARAMAAGLAGEKLADLRLAVAEIVTNAILHGRLPHWVHVWLDGDDVVCEVEDGGAGVPSPVTGLVVPPSDSPAGRGVWVARQLCDRLEISGARVRLRVRV